MSMRRAAPARRVLAARPARVVLAQAGIKGGGGKGGEEGGKDFGNTVYGQIAKNGDCVLFGTSISRTGAEDMLKDEEKEYTVFCPDDDAMAKFAKANGVTKLSMYDLEGLPEMVKDHIVEGKFAMADLPEEITTISGKTVSTPKVVLNRGQGKKQWANFNSTNGCFHIIDTYISA